uniref:YbaK/aminoacyl-tRNA synthetase-associated domain-containing protein n=1 Tax=Oryza meridionalis TaxID=40149 RepID=A0A0E0CPE6_9ORYZ
MDAAAADLGARQLRILRRVADLELAAQQHRLGALSISAAPSGGEAETGATEARLSSILTARGVLDFTFRRVPADYYDRPLEERRDLLRADSVDQLCKSIVMVNTQAAADVVDCSNPKNSKYYVVVVQYMARLNADSIKNFIYALNEKQIPKKRFNMRLAPEEESLKLTGFVHNAVTCIGMETDIPVIIDEAITKLDKDFFWLGGGEVDLKLGVRTSQFLNAFKPFVVKCS